jgi:hypothetical protein
VSYAKGFLVPLGAGELTVRVAARRQPLDRALLDRLDAALPEGAAALDAALRRAGFSVRERTVLEPQ